MQLNQTSGQTWICNTILPYLAKRLDWIKCMDLNIKYLRETEKTTKILSVYPLFRNKCMFIQIPLIYANIYKITDEWNLQVTKHLLFKQIQLKEGFSKNCVYSFSFERRFQYKRFWMQPCNFLGAIFSPLRIWNQKRQYNDSKYDNNRSKLCTILFSFIRFFTFCVLHLLADTTAPKQWS